MHRSRPTEWRASDSTKPECQPEIPVFRCFGRMAPPRFRTGGPGIRPPGLPWLIIGEKGTEWDPGRTRQAASSGAEARHRLDWIRHANGARESLSLRERRFQTNRLNPNRLVAESRSGNRFFPGPPGGSLLGFERAARRIRKAIDFLTIIIRRVFEEARFGDNHGIKVWAGA